MAVTLRSHMAATLALFVVLAAASPALAQTTTIVAVTPTSASPTQLDVFGTNFVVGGIGPLSVTLAGHPAAFLIISDGPVNDLLTVDIPAAVLLAGPGSYQLRVSQSAAAGRTAISEVAIPAEGPQGQPGGPGPPGSEGPQGDPGPPGPPGSANIQGTANRIIKFTSATSGGDSLLFDNGTNLGLGTTMPAFPVDVVGTNALTIVNVRNANANGDSITGVNTAAAGTGNGTGVLGVTAQSGPLSAGIFGHNSHQTGTGVIGVGNGAGSSVLPSGSGGAFSGFTTGVYARSLTAGVGEAIYADQFGEVVRVGYWNGSQFYKIHGVGVVSTHVKDPTDPAGQRRVSLHAPEAPEVYFMDFGTGMLKNGRAHIELDPRLTGNVTVDDTHPMRVFIQLEDDERTRGVVVKNKTKTGFDVVEVGGGRSKQAFQWQVWLNRADEAVGDGQLSRYSGTRFEPAPDDGRETKR